MKKIEKEEVRMLVPLCTTRKKISGRGGIRTHAIEMTGALNQRLRPLGHPTLHCVVVTNNTHMASFFAGEYFL